MNPLELRHEIHSGLVNRNRPPALISAEKLSPVPGEPVALEVVAQDPFSRPSATRRYRVTIEEITDDPQSAAEEEDARLIRKYDGN